MYKRQITYALSGLERGDWTETDVFYRGSQEVIGASKMDEKLLEEIRRQEAREADEAEAGEEVHAAPAEDEVPGTEPAADDVAKPSGQQTLMGFGSDA